MGKMPLAWLLCLALLAPGLGCNDKKENRGLSNSSDSGPGASRAQSPSRRSPDLIKIHGIFIPTRRIKIKSEFSGRLDNLRVLRGQAVSSQSPLFRIEDDELSEELERRRAELRVAEIQLEQIRSLADVEPAGEDISEETVVERPVAEAIQELPPYQEPTFSRLASEIPFTSVDAGGIWPGIDPRLIERSQDPQDAGGIWPSYGVREKVSDEGFNAAWSAFFPAASWPMPIRAEEFTSAQNLILTRTSQPEEIPSDPAPPSMPGPSEGESRLSLYRARVDLMRAEIAALENEWASREISSPLDGRIHELAVSEGSMVQAGDLLFEIYQVDPIGFSFQIPKEQADFLELGMTIRGKLSDAADIVFEGEISYIAAELNPDGESLEVRARMANPDDAFKVGAKGNAEIDLKSEFTAQIP